MSGYLLDEHVPRAIRTQLLRLDPELAVFRVGDGFAPAISTPDSELLDWIENHDCLLVTKNRSTMPVHLGNHLAKGKHAPGIVLLPKKFHLPSIIEDLLLIALASFPGELRDQIIYLPLSP